MNILWDYLVAEFGLYGKLVHKHSMHSDARLISCLKIEIPTNPRPVRAGLGGGGSLARECILRNTLA